MLNKVHLAIVILIIVLLFIGLFFAVVSLISSNSDNNFSNSGICNYEDEKYWYQTDRTISDNKPDVFYVVSTVLLRSYTDNGEESKLASLNSEDIKAMDSEIGDIATNMFTEEFNFFAPYYHEITMNTALNSTLVEDIDYFNKAQAEVNDAFDYYYNNINSGRPFVIAGYSQGAVLAKGILKHMNDEQIDNMAAAYIMGGPISNKDLEHNNIIPAANADDIHVTVSYNSVASIDACWEPLTGINVDCINPINWTTEELPANFEYKGKEGKVHVDKNNHVLIVEGLDPNDYYLLDWPFPFGNYHNEEIHFYSSSIRENALNRVDNLISSR